MTLFTGSPDFRESLVRANPALSKFDPLEEIIFFDDFDYGLNGWTEVLGNYQAKYENVTDYPELMDSRPPMLSTATMHDSGSAGSFNGIYSMKVTTRGTEGHVAKALKRITYRKQARLQCEAYFTFKPEASELSLSELDVRAVGISYDLQDDHKREWPAVRFLNAMGSERLERWQYHVGGSRAPHLDAWEDIPDARQPLCYNETATKQNWHYVRWLIDLASHRYLELQCNDRTWDLAKYPFPSLRTYPNLRTLLNLGFYVEANANKRSFFYIDSVLLSTER